jgi:hypothetical protein
VAGNRGLGPVDEYSAIADSLEGWSERLHRQMNPPARTTVTRNDLEIAEALSEQLEKALRVGRGRNNAGEARWVEWLDRAFVTPRALALVEREPSVFDRTAQ